MGGWGSLTQLKLVSQDIFSDNASTKYCKHSLGFALTSHHQTPYPLKPNLSPVKKQKKKLRILSTFAVCQFLSVVVNSCFKQSICKCLRIMIWTSSWHQIGGRMEQFFDKLFEIFVHRYCHDWHCFLFLFLFPFFFLVFQFSYYQNCFSFQIHQQFLHTFLLSISVSSTRKKKGVRSEK